MARTLKVVEDRCEQIIDTVIRGITRTLVFNVSN